uniref:Uncharacterized protein n=1 Tax=Oryzias sinensis TaxID=183150 RepID=A0A8C8DYE4_9TELE
GPDTSPAPPSSPRPVSGTRCTWSPGSIHAQVPLEVSVAAGGRASEVAPDCTTVSSHRRAADLGFNLQLSLQLCYPKKHFFYLESFFKPLIVQGWVYFMLEN